MQSAEDLLQDGQSPGGQLVWNLQFRGNSRIHTSAQGRQNRARAPVKFFFGPSNKVGPAKSGNYYYYYYYLFTYYHHHYHHHHYYQLPPPPPPLPLPLPLLQLSCHPVAVVLTPVQTKQITINIHERNNTKAR